MGLRRKSRELALQFLYGHDSQGLSCRQDQLEKGLRDFVDSFETDGKTLPYARELVCGLCELREQIDDLLTRHARNWRLERMSVVDRNILRLAAYEMPYREDVPAQVAINEALEVAKRYSTDDSVAFINGILDALLQDASAE